MAMVSLAGSRTVGTGSCPGRIAAVSTATNDSPMTMPSLRMFSGPDDGARKVLVITMATIPMTAIEPRVMMPRVSIRLRFSSCFCCSRMLRAFSRASSRRGLGLVPVLSYVIGPLRVIRLRGGKGHR